MKHLIPSLILALFATGAHALATPNEVAGTCMEQMRGDICLAKPDRNTIQPGQPLLIAGVGSVANGRDAYLDYVDLYSPPKGGVPDLRMCALAMEKMTADPGGAHDIVARSLWTPPERPSEQVVQAMQAARVAEQDTAMRTQVLQRLGIAIAACVLAGLVLASGLALALRCANSLTRNKELQWHS